MKMLRWMRGHTKLDRTGNIIVRKKIGIIHVVEKMIEYSVLCDKEMWGNDILL